MDYKKLPAVPKVLRTHFLSFIHWAILTLVRCSEARLSFVTHHSDTSGSRYLVFLLFLSQPVLGKLTTISATPRRSKPHSVVFPLI